MRDSNPVITLLIGAWIVFLVVLSIGLIVESFGLLFWASDIFHLAPQGASEPERVLFGLGLLILVSCANGTGD